MGPELCKTLEIRLECMRECVCMCGIVVKQGWVQQIYKYLLDFYPCSSSSCMYVWSARGIEVKCGLRHKDFCCASQIGHLTTLFLLLNRTEAKGQEGHE